MSKPPMIKPCKEALIERLAATAPITYEMVCEAYGGQPPLIEDTARAAFFAVWALMAVEYARELAHQLSEEPTP